MHEYALGNARYSAVSVDDTAERASRPVAIERWHCSIALLKQSECVSVRALAAGCSGACGQPAPHTLVMFCELRPASKSSAAPGPSSWRLLERRAVAGRHCLPAGNPPRLSAPSPPRQHQPERSRPRGWRPPAGPQQIPAAKPRLLKL